MRTTRIVLARRPEGLPDVSCFETHNCDEADLPPLRPGQILVAVEHLSLDPYMRARMSDRKSYKPPVALGSVMPGEAVARILLSEHPSLKRHECVIAHTGWQSHAIVDGGSVRRLPDLGLPSTAFLGVLGMPGLTAYSGLTEIGRVQPGETLVVAAATGPVGSMVGQIARMKGARVVGIAGGETKCKALIEQLGFDSAVDHRSASFAADLGAACPNGIDVYFESVGGNVFNTVLPHLNPFARVPVCGLISQWTTNREPSSPLAVDLLRATLDKSLSIRGFVVGEFAERYRQTFEQTVSSWLRDGSIVALEHSVDGLENAPDAFVDLLQGRNIGKVVVNVA